MKSSAPFGCAQGKRGFTLVELLVVISIIAILSVIGITVFSSAQKSARDGRRRADLHAIALALEQYKTVNNTYPVTPKNTWVTSASAEWTSLLDSKYIAQMPKDPKSNGDYPWGPDYGYAYYSSDGYPPGKNGGWFMLIGKLESPSDADRKTKCIMPDGTCWGGTLAGCGAGRIQPNDFHLCSQQ